MDWNKDYFDMLSMFNEENVEYLIVGAYAMAVYGCPRSTGTSISGFVLPR